ncbi:MAG: peptidylprolyl isomerase [Acidobacteria bacterium]|nr:peptidylprolyl isomerase [Acidobacteriota bacterium]
MNRRLVTLVVLLSSAGIVAGQEPNAGRSSADVVAAAPDAAWRQLEPENTVYFALPEGRFVMELAPWSAPAHVENLKAMVRAGMFDGGAVVRSQDNYVAQWRIRVGEASPAGVAETLPAEFSFPAASAPFAPLQDGDIYAPQVGFSRGFPIGHDPATGTSWIAHCYGSVAVARGVDPNSGSAASLAAVTGHSPRHLDRNSSMVGRVVAGMEQLTTLSRGTGNLGFYEGENDPVPVLSAKVGSDLPAANRLDLEVMRTDSDSFRDFISARRSPANEWYAHRAGRVELCNVKVPIRNPDR